MKIQFTGHYLYGMLSGFALIFTGCSRTGQTATEAPRQHYATPTPMYNKTVAAMAPVRIYKMKRDYSKNVPVTMDATHTKIISYPAPTDLRLNGKLAYPTPLNDGFWLDNRGIDRNVAFLSYTYEEYSRLPQAPSLEQLSAAIIDKDPLTEFHYCGTRNQYTHIVEELNELIEQQYKQ